MNLKGLKLGVALCGSYCTYDSVFIQFEKLLEMGVEIYPIMSMNAYTTDTRFGKADDFVKKLEQLTGRKVIHTIVEAEPLGPKNIIDALLIAPCTGNTLAKMASAVTDTSVLMATKALMRNKKPIIIGLATNDGLGFNFANIAKLMNVNNIYFVPIGQDNCIKKPNSLVAHMDLIPETIEKAINHEQIQPILQSYK